MKSPRWFPHPASWATAVALYVFATGVTVAMAIVVPRLLELMDSSPRLAWAGILATFCAPIPAAAAVHGVAHGLLDLGDTKGVRRPAGANMWAGFVAWASILFVNVTTALVMLTLNPPPMDPGAFQSLALHAAGGAPGVHTFVWILVAAQVYELERRASHSEA